MEEFCLSTLCLRHTRGWGGLWKLQEKIPKLTSNKRTKLSGNRDIFGLEEGEGADSEDLGGGQDPIITWKGKNKVKIEIDLQGRLEKSK